MTTEAPKTDAYLTEAERIIKAHQEKRKISLNVTGKIVTGYITEIEEDRNGLTFKTEHEMVHWGGQVYPTSHSFLRRDGYKMYEATL